MTEGWRRARGERAGKDARGERAGKDARGEQVGKDARGGRVGKDARGERVGKDACGKRAREGAGRGPRGSSYVELLAALALLGIAVLCSAGLLLRCRALSAGMEERARAAHAAASEMDRLRALGLGSLPLGEGGWRSGADRASGLRGAAGKVVVERFEGTPLRRVRVVLRWGGGKSLVRETLAGGAP